MQNYEVVEMYREKGKIIIVVKSAESGRSINHRVPKRRLGIRWGSDDVLETDTWLENGALVPLFDPNSKSIVLETEAALHAFRVLLAITAEQCGALTLEKLDDETYCLAAECLAEAKEVAAAWPIPVKTAGHNSAATC